MSLSATALLFQTSNDWNLTQRNVTLQNYVGPMTTCYAAIKQRRSQEFDLGGYKLHDIEFVLGQGDKTTT